jgi:dTDP-4-amino-4,6-dideoxygalactose transaminase
MIVRIRPLLDIEKISRASALIKEEDASLIKNFENAFASYLGSSCAFAIDKGRSALLLALKILDIKQGDEVIVQSYIFNIVIDAILEVGAKPVLVDSSLDDFNISTGAIEKEITPRTKAIIVTHLGIPCDLEEINEIARKNNCYLIENCAHTLGAQYKGKNVGTFGDVSFFSFDVDKPMTTGDGGMLVINNGSLLDKTHQILLSYKKVTLAKEKEIIDGLLLYHYVTSEEIYPEKGFLPVDFGKNAVMNDKKLKSMVESAAKHGSDEGFRSHVLPYLQSKDLLCHRTSWPSNLMSRIYGRVLVALGSVTIPKIDSSELLMNSLRSAVGLEGLKEFNMARDLRNRNTQYYVDYLDKSAFIQPLADEGKEPAFIRYAVLNNTKYENSYISGAAKEHGFEIGIFNWSAPVHLCYPYNKLLSFDPKRLTNSEHLGKRLLSLPVHPYVDEGALKKIVQFLNNLGRSSC